MVQVVFHLADPPRTAWPGPIHVALYDGLAGRGFPRVGRPVRQQVRRLGLPVPVRAFDFLTLALAATAADTFINRETHSETGWDRDIQLDVPLAHPDAWREALPVLRAAVRFLTGDRWEISVRDGGVAPPRRMDPRANLINLDGADRVCLFSGGLDSTIGVRDLVAAGAKPLLVSHSYRLDKGKQERIRDQAYPGLPRFALLANPTCGTGMHPDPRGNDITMRGRSLNFLAAAAVAASVVAERTGERVRIVVPENGFIAINAPLTSRRLGSLSTRTTHPHFLGLIQQIFDLLSIPADITNPYEFKTKGEMLQGWSGGDALAAETVSCGKWKRKGVHCGRCVPCLVRRASFHAAGIADPTSAYTYGDPEAILKSNGRADVMALSRAAAWTPEELAQAVGASGPLPPTPAARAPYEEVVARGLAEVRSYLAAHNVTT